MLKNLGAKINIIVEYVIANNVRNKRSFSIGWATVFLVVTFLSLIQNALGRSGLVFLKLSEDQIGAFDFLIVPQPSANANLQSQFLNFAQVNSSLSGIPAIAGVAGRWVISVNVTRSGLSPASATLLVMDTEYERQIHLGRAWRHRGLGTGEVHVSASLLRTLGIYPNHGSQIELTASSSGAFSDPATQALLVNATSNGLSGTEVLIPSAAFAGLPSGIQQTLLNSAGTRTTSSGTVVNAGSVFRQNSNSSDVLLKLNVTVIDSVETPDGKYPGSIGNVIIMDRSYAQQLVATPFDILIPGFSALASFQSNVSLYDYAMSIVVNLADRIEVYSQPSDSRQNRIISVSNKIAAKLGYDAPITLVDVLNQALGATVFIRIFLDELFFTILTVLGILSVVLVSSLILSDSEEKTFEYGILRSLGLESRSLILLLCLQAFLFAIPGIVLGIISCLLINVPVGYILSTFLGSQVDFSLDPSSITLGVVLGLILPVLGILVPIRRALSNTIRDSLDIYHNAVFDTQIQIQKLADIGLSFTNTVIAVLMIVIGFMVYYLVPLAFALGRFELFFRILSIISLGMFLGQVMVADSVQLFLQRIFAKALTYGFNDRKLSQMVIKNIGGHVSRNRKTSLMFTLCLGYIIFSSTMFQLQTLSLSQNLQWFYGADLNINSKSFDKPLADAKLRPFMNSLVKSKLVISYSFASFPLNSYYGTKNIKIGRLASVKQVTSQIVALDTSYVDAALTQFFVPTEVNNNLVHFNSTTSRGPTNLISGLYTTISGTGPPPKSVLTNGLRSNTQQFPGNGSIYDNGVPIILAEGLRDVCSIDTSQPIALSVDYGTTLRYLAYPIAMLTKAPGFTGVSRSKSSNAPAFISTDWFLKLLNDVQRGVNDTTAKYTSVPMQTLFIKLEASMTSREIEALVNEINTFLDDDSFVVTDLRDKIASTDSASGFLMIMFYVVDFVGVVFSFFVLLISFTSNIRENSWELGVLRAIGLTQFAVAKVYIYEALAVIFGSVFVGSALGIVTATALTLQSNLFNELPFQFAFPTTLFLVVVSSSVVLAILGSYIPVASYNKKPIAVILRG